VEKELLSEHRIRLNRSLGQHFLFDPQILERIVQAADVTKDDLVLEIGAGIGTLTKVIAKHAGFVIAFEMDSKLIEAATKNLKDLKNVLLINEDIMKAFIKKILEKQTGFKSIKVVANVPYYITSPLISLLLEGDVKYKCIVLTIQKEVAERIAGTPGNKKYGSFTIFVNYYAKPKISFLIPAKCFTPPPKVDSAVIRLDVLDEPPVKVKDEKMFFRVVHAAFMQRRKTLRNAIINAFIPGVDAAKLDKALKHCSIDGKRRGETLSLQEFASLSNTLI
jgi:16S rRNA (adenine1518-N6/adenine1519-N6)-dimethyltransferase